MFKVALIAIVLFGGINVCNGDTLPDTTAYNSIISPSNKAAINDSSNLIYCSSFEITWKKLQETIFKQPIILNKKTWWVAEVNNKSKLDVLTISEEYYSAYAGFAKDKIDLQFKDDLQRRFKYEYITKNTLSSQDICSFSYMKKNVSFKSVFYEIKTRKLIFNKQKEVDFFGVNDGWSGHYDNFVVHDYRNKDDFIFQIITDDDIDEVYLAKIQPRKTLIDTYESVMNRVKKGKATSLELKDQLGIPYINFNLEKEYNEIYEAPILNQGFQKYRFGKVIQIIDFNLNELGITLESTAEMANRVFGGPKKIDTPRVLNFDKPFLIIMKEKWASQPYFLMWVANADLMMKK